ncbi:MAG TPA: globin [Stenomitos sp.]
MTISTNGLNPPPRNPNEPLYEQIGPDVIDRLVRAFYPRVAADPELSPIFPTDLTEVAEKQRLFLTQFLGGPPLYSEVHGHPRMRARHMPFPITPARARAWLRNMAAAMDEVGLAGPVRDEFFQRLTLTAQHMVNQVDELEPLP